MNSEVIFGQLESEMEMRFSGKIVEHTEKTTFSSPIPILYRFKFDTVLPSYFAFW